MEQFWGRKRKHPVYREHRLRKNLFKQLHRQGADSALLFGGVSDGDGLVRYPFGKPLRQPRRGGSEGAGLPDILDCDLLIIDDLGTELINTFTVSQLFYCVNERLNRQKGTIISTNLSLNQMRDEFTERVTSRILSQYRILPLLGEGFDGWQRGDIPA